MIRPDLHMHSTFSDGVLSPKDVVEKAASMGVTVMAITDHDTLEGVDSLRGEETPIPVLPGVELSLRDMPSLHLLGYGFAPANALREKVAQLAHKRVQRAEAMVTLLEDLGMPLDWAQITQGYQGTVGRAHIARAMMRKAYVSTMTEAFDKYLGEGKPAYVAGERLSMGEALPLMRQSGFVPVLAHPALLNLDELSLRPLLCAWKEQGLMGVEVYHPAQMHRCAQFDSMARSLGLLVTGGSDFHKCGDHHGSPGAVCGKWPCAQQDVAALIAAMNEKY